MGTQNPDVVCLLVSCFVFEEQKRFFTAIFSSFFLLSLLLQRFKKVDPKLSRIRIRSNPKNDLLLKRNAQ